MTMYRDIETNNVITENELKKEYKELIENGNIDETLTFTMYAQNCLTAFGGTLKIIG